MASPSLPLVRIVRMTFRPDALDTFLAIFDRASPHIRATEGCLHLELWQDPRYPGVVTTFSEWMSEEALNAYRGSDLFRSTWSETRVLFASPPVARSHYRLRTVSASSP